VSELYLAPQARDRTYRLHVEPLLVVVLYVLDFSLSAGKTHVAIIDAVLAEVLLARGTLDQFVGFDFRTT
jgi:hypothetical protein